MRVIGAGLTCCGRGCLCHATALVGATTAGLGASLAMVHLVLGALFGTCLADVSAKRANRRRVLAAASHGGRGKLADGCAVHVQRDAARHHLHVLLLQARRRAVIAGGGTLIAGLDARGVLLVGHVLAPSRKPEIRLPQKARRAPTAIPAKSPNTSAPTPAHAARETSVDASGRCCSRSGQNYSWPGGVGKVAGYALAMKATTGVALAARIGHLRSSHRTLNAHGDDISVMFGALDGRAALMPPAGRLKWRTTAQPASLQTRG